ncbi:hypothetical protein CCR87_07040 [Rhodobaculum claviforme]|uniref:Carboxypeptidase regulatory-like domain-containing protein n=1 Tax=Rhodobaculum claviforme TaxID=1549854 RepID=A0A934TJ43_9RHOB|nr:hypothetical protein [Rhodobaculum claviforme]
MVAAAPLPALAHAALLEAEVATAVRLLARYDTGAPMQGAQVIIYAPDTPAEAWDRGTTDAEGRFVFVPDPALPGRWSIQVRQAGHGALTHVQIGAGAPGAGPETAPVPAAVIERPATTAGPMQRAVMVALVAWGALGTALYFRRRGHGDASA